MSLAAVIVRLLSGYTAGGLALGAAGFSRALGGWLLVAADVFMGTSAVAGRHAAINSVGRGAGLGLGGAYPAACLGVRHRRALYA